MPLEYEDDSKLFACFKLQAEVFQAQFKICKHFEEYLKSECVAELPEADHSKNSIAVLEERAKRGPQNRLVNDFEMTILGRYFLLALADKM